jgi:hypothetical protein
MTNVEREALSGIVGLLSPASLGLPSAINRISLSAFVEMRIVSV